MNIKENLFKLNYYVEIDTVYPMELLHSYDEVIVYSNIIGEVMEFDGKSITIRTFDVNIENAHSLMISCKNKEESVIVTTNIDNKYIIRINYPNIQIGDLLQLNTLYIARILNPNKNNSIIFFVSDSLEIYTQQDNDLSELNIGYNSDEYDIEDDIYDNLFQLQLCTEGWYPEARECTCCQGFKYKCICTEGYTNETCVCQN